MQGGRDEGECGARLSVVQGRVWCKVECGARLSVVQGGEWCKGLD